MQRKFSFLSQNHLTPLRVNNGTAVLTRADMFQNLQPIRTDTIFLDHDIRETLLSSLQVDIQTEAKYLALAFHYGVFQKAFRLDSDRNLYPGLFGKMNLPSTEISIVDCDDGGRQYPIHLSNVQFELDFSMEDDRFIYLIEAKMGRPKAKSFNIQQLFYPYALLQNRAQRDHKEIRAFFVNISPEAGSSIVYDFYEYSFTIPFVVNSIRLELMTRVQLQIEADVNARLVGN
jgi:hypothetical protein